MREILFYEKKKWLKKVKTERCKIASENFYFFSIHFQSVFWKLFILITQFGFLITSLLCNLYVNFELLKNEMWSKIWSPFIIFEWKGIGFSRSVIDWRRRTAEGRGAEDNPNWLFRLFHKMSIFLKAIPGMCESNSWK